MAGNWSDGVKNSQPICNNRPVSFGLRPELFGDRFLLRKPTSVLLYPACNWKAPNFPLFFFYIKSRWTKKTGISLPVRP